jgi:hypothetical protein
MQLPLLEVVRGWVLSPEGSAPRTGVVRLIAMRSRVDGIEPERAPETSRWLESIRSRLAPRIPLGTRLEVIAPRYVDFSIVAKLECDEGRDPASVKTAVEKTLRSRLALVEFEGAQPRQPGAPVTRRDLAAWIRGTEGVTRIFDLKLLNAKGRSVDTIAVSPSGLPRWSSTRSSIDVSRSGTGGPQ